MHTYCTYKRNNLSGKEDGGGRGDEEQSLSLYLEAARIMKHNQFNSLDHDISLRGQDSAFPCPSSS